MHTTDTKNQFVKLRAQGWSFARIAAQLRVSKPTLLSWNRQSQAQLRSPRALELKALQESLLPDEELFRCTIFLRTVEQELASRSLRKLSTAELHRLASLLRLRLDELQPVNQQSNERSNSVNSALP
jgi:hypothetical protein